VKIYQTKSKKLSGSEFHEVYPKAFALYRTIKNRSKRRPYVRCAYFKKDKVFIDYFWGHLWQKNWKDRMRRLKYYPCALDLLKNSKIDPVAQQNRNNKLQLLHRFMGITSDKELFVVQVSENKQTGQKNFLSVFPL
jgi:hypothetical protein